MGNKKLINSMRQAPNLERTFCKSKYISAEKHFQVHSCGKYCVWFFPKKNFHLIGRGGTLFTLLLVKAARKNTLAKLAAWWRKEQTYRQHIREPHYQQIDVEEHFRLSSNGEFQILPLL